MAQESFVHVPGMTYIIANKSYSGSHEGMRYHVRVEDGQFVACVWPDPWCFEKTDDALKVTALFPQDEDGLAAAQRWIEEQYKKEPSRWIPKNFLEV